MSPWATARQRRWGNSTAGIAAMGSAKVHEFNEASKGMKLPASAARHAAARLVRGPSAGREKRAQAKAMSKSKRVRVRRKKGAY